MNKKIVKYIAIFFIGSFFINMIAGIGINTWFISDIFKKKESYNVDPMFEEKRIKSDILHKIYYPKIDSLIEVNPEVAILYLEKIIPNYPGIPSLILKKGIAYHKIDSLKHAIIEFEKCKNMVDYPYRIAIEYKVDCLLKQDKNEEAINELLETAELDSNYLYDIAILYE